MVFRLTNKLFKRIREKPPNEIVEETNPFLDWAADHFTVDGYRFIIVTNCASVLSWVFPAKGINDSNGFVKAANRAMETCLREYGFHFQWERMIVPSLVSVHLRKVADPSMSGVLTDLVRHAKYYLSNPNMTPHQASLLLNEMPQCSRKEPYTIRAFQNLSL